MEQRRITSVNELYNKNNKFIGFYDIDASGVDLSSIREHELYLQYVTNANLSNTNITLHFNKYGLGNIIYRNCNLKGVGIDTDIEDWCFYKFMHSNDNKLIFSNVIFDEKQIKLLNELGKSYSDFIKYDFETIKNNPNLSVDSYSFYMILYDSLCFHFLNSIVSEDKIIKEFDDYVEKMILYDKNGGFKKLYDVVSPQLNIAEKINWLCRKRIEKPITIKNLIIDFDMYRILRYSNISDCVLEDVCFDLSFKNLFSDKRNYPYNKIFSVNSVKNVSMPNINYSNWEDGLKDRISKTPFTFRNNLYLELGRKCNGKCSFCRNSCMEKSKYDFKEIKHQLREYINFMDSVVIGGGEPTLLEKDLLKLLRSMYYSERRRISVFSNGSADYELYNNLIELNVGLDISRHHFDDSINADILGINKKKLLSISNCDFTNLSPAVTLACTCINGGIDTVDKIIKYINEFYKLGINKFMFCNLQDDASVSNNGKNNRCLEIKQSIFQDVINLLLMQGYKNSYQIVSSGGYKMNILKTDNMSIVFKEYISKEELKKLWGHAVKRTFDLSMAPDGSIYENWSETGEKVKTLS